MTGRSTARPQRPVSVRGEFKRKFLHLSMIVVPLWVLFAPRPIDLLGLIIATLASIGTDLLRLRNDRFKRYFQRLFRPLIRSHEEEHLLGSTHFMIASLICALVFEESIAVSALAFLVLGDTVAAIVGKKFGKPLYWGKSLEGSTACFICCLIVGYPLIDSRWVILAGAFSATVAEALRAPLNDNMRVPVASGLIMQIVSYYTQG